MCGGKFLILVVSSKKIAKYVLNIVACTKCRALHSHPTYNYLMQKTAGPLVSKNPIHGVMTTVTIQARPNAKNTGS